MHVSRNNNARVQNKITLWVIYRWGAMHSSGGFSSYTSPTVKQEIIIVLRYEDAYTCLPWVLSSGIEDFCMYRFMHPASICSVEVMSQIGLISESFWEKITRAELLCAATSFSRNPRTETASSEIFDSKLLRNAFWKSSPLYYSHSLVGGVMMQQY